MNELNLKESVGRALRAMKKEPAALLFIDGATEWTCDVAEVCGIPIFHGTGLVCQTWGCDPLDCPFVPIGRRDDEITYRDRRAFSEAWSA